MQWLSKGRKHCPICRDWYVPGTRIDDQKKAHGDAWKRALKEMKRKQKEEEEKNKVMQREQQIEKEDAQRQSESDDDDDSNKNQV